MSTQKELVKQKLDLLTKVPYEFIVASYNLAVSNNFIESTNFYGNSECPRSKEVERFKTIISPLFLLSDNDKRRELNESARSELVEFFKNYPSAELLTDKAIEETRILKNKLNNQVQVLENNKNIHENFYAFLSELYSEHLLSLKNDEIIDVVNDHTEYNQTLTMYIFDGIVFGRDIYVPDYLFYTRKEKYFMAGIVESIKDSCQEYLNSEGESEQE